MACSQFKFGDVLQVAVCLTVTMYWCIDYFLKERSYESLMTNDIRSNEYAQCVWNLALVFVYIPIVLSYHCLYKYMLMYASVIHVCNKSLHYILQLICSFFVCILYYTLYMLCIWLRVCICWTVDKSSEKKALNNC